MKQLTDGKVEQNLYPVMNVPPRWKSDTIVEDITKREEIEDWKGYGRGRS